MLTGFGDADGLPRIFSGVEEILKEMYGSW